MEILNDFQTSVRRALEEIDPNYEQYNGLVICGTHAPHDTEMMIEKIREAREKKRHAHLICFGHQLCAIEYARNVLGTKDATSEELNTCELHSFQVKDYHSSDPLPPPIIPCTCGTFVVRRRHEMKVGLHEGESWWSNYEVNIEFTTPPYFIAIPFHPEYQSSKQKPHPLLVEFIKQCKK